MKHLLDVSKYVQTSSSFHIERMLSAGCFRLCGLDCKGLIIFHKSHCVHISGPLFPARFWPPSLVSGRLGYWRLGRLSFPATGRWPKMLAYNVYKQPIFLVNFNFVNRSNTKPEESQNSGSPCLRVCACQFHNMMSSLTSSLFAYSIVKPQWVGTRRGQLAINPIFS